MGLIEALLLVRLISKLFAVRPDQELLQFVLRVTAPLVLPFSLFDQGQPLFGARLEFSTLIVCLLIPVLWIGIIWGSKRFFSKKRIENVG